MPEEVKKFYADFKKRFGEMQKDAPKLTSGFMGLFNNVMAEGRLTVAEKEAVALGIAVAVHCKECIRLHVQKCLDAGLSREQILEAAGVAVVMGGGPAFTQVPEVLAALEALESA